MSEFLENYATYFKAVCEKYMRNPIKENELQLQYVVIIMGKKAQGRLINEIPEIFGSMNREQVVNKIRGVLGLNREDDKYKDFIKEYTDFWWPLPHISDIVVEV